MDNIYKNNKENNPNKKRKILIIFHDMIADMISNNPASIRLQDFKSSKLQDFKISRLQVFKTSSRRLDQDAHIRLTHTSAEDVFRSSWRRLNLDQYIRLGHTCSRRLENIFKMSGQDVSKTSSRRYQDVLQKLLQDIFKTS